ncbi:undecaprenyl-phosphate galactosephosphotransferase [Parvularcula bermudensis HTCC2503]|uniref:Undecaprenyl-phosphate galactosephosphotransferase n=1 Tax=Parvularcula bermudensis (strain ATCC BAA-594 / HTCC2503 / KCTC 12087) TaxID=314260 RepID=E0TFX9_PARBH|nr:sugar transferase [Parvularcula bermudensis]ADM09578.1 undecaprenyl-phosphate galactosephosphotransferase [Parvularcula bermudensis HTCC2503]
MATEQFIPSVRTASHFSGARWVKRAGDIVVSLAALLFLFPLLLLLVFLIKGDGGPVLFSHQRVGKDGKVFSCLKFRTMVPGASAKLAEVLAADPRAAEEWAAAYKLSNDPRITKAGNFLRVTGLDELPQLLNVLKGEMSLVGPRPIVEPELTRYGPYKGYYLSVRPGITGLWQVSGRNAISYGRRVALDKRYVETWSLWADIVILARTPIEVLFARGR